MNDANLIDLLRRAQTEELGLFVTTNNPHAMSLKLHAVKRAHPEFFGIEITIPSTPETVMLVKKTVELDEPVWEAPSLEIE
jgi:hypothetical protein